MGSKNDDTRPGNTTKTYTKGLESITRVRGRVRGGTKYHHTKPLGLLVKIEEVRRSFEKFRGSSRTFRGSFEYTRYSFEVVAKDKYECR